jgi:hypothetical protein
MKAFAVGLSNHRTQARASFPMRVDVTVQGSRLRCTVAYPSFLFISKPLLLTTHIELCAANPVDQAGGRQDLAAGARKTFHPIKTL